MHDLVKFVEGCASLCLFQSLYKPINSLLLVLFLYLEAILFMSDDRKLAQNESEYSYKLCRRNHQEIRSGQVRSGQVRSGQAELCVGSFLDVSRRNFYNESFPAISASRMVDNYDALPIARVYKCL